MKGSSSGGTTTYPITIRIDDTDGLRPGMNANAEIVVAEAGNASSCRMLPSSAAAMCW